MPGALKRGPTACSRRDDRCIPNRQAQSSVLRRSDRTKGHRSITCPSTRGRICREVMGSAPCQVETYVSGDNVIIRCVRWYLRFKLSYRDMAEIAWELGVSVAPSTILRW